MSPRVKWFTREPFKLLTNGLQDICVRDSRRGRRRTQLELDERGRARTSKQAPSRYARDVRVTICDTPVVTVDTSSRRFVVSSHDRRRHKHPSFKACIIFTGIRLASTCSAFLYLSEQLRAPPGLPVRRWKPRRHCSGHWLPHLPRSLSDSSDPFR